MKKKDNKPARQLTEEDKKAFLRSIGLFAGLISKSFLEAGGCEVDYRINGESIVCIEKLCELDISERIKLAIKEERYEDAANFKKILDKKRQLPSE